VKHQLSFRPDTAPGQVLKIWWLGLTENKGDRAELRRAHNLTAIALTAAYQRLYAMLLNAGLSAPKHPESSQQMEKLAAIAGLLAHVKSLGETGLPQAMSEGDRPSVSELRFRRLLESPTIDDLYLGLRRALPVIDHTANIHELANAIWFWGDKTKKQ